MSAFFTPILSPLVDVSITRDSHYLLKCIDRGPKYTVKRVTIPLHYDNLKLKIHAFLFIKSKYFLQHHFWIRHIRAPLKFYISSNIEVAVQIEL